MHIKIYHIYTYVFYVYNTFYIFSKLARIVNYFLRILVDKSCYFEKIQQNQHFLHFNYSKNLCFTNS